MSKPYTCIENLIVSLNHRITPHLPLHAGALHHQVDHHGDQVGHDVGAAGDLVAVGGALPGGAAVDELVAEGVEAVEEFGQDAVGAHLADGAVGAGLGVAEAVLPGGLVDGAFFVVPEGLEHVLVVQEAAD